jgi:hypothetical protein
VSWVGRASGWALACGVIRALVACEASCEERLDCGPYVPEESGTGVRRAAAEPALAAQERSRAEVPAARAQRGTALAARAGEQREVAQVEPVP